MELTFLQISFLIVIMTAVYLYHTFRLSYWTVCGMYFGFGMAGMISNDFLVMMVGMGVSVILVAQYYSAKAKLAAQERHINSKDILK